MVVLVADQDALASPPHAMFLVVFLQSLQPRKYGRVFLWLAILGPKCVVAERIQADGLRLVCIEVFREGRAGDSQHGIPRTRSMISPTDTSSAKLL